jgi:uracil-DNA glycosylase family 4
MPEGFRALAAEVTTCERCLRLREWCVQVAQQKRRAYRDETYWGLPVPGFGDPSARVLVVGLAPGAHGANRTGRFFTGDSSGDFLYTALHRAGYANQPISRHADDGLCLSDAYVSAVCRCAPPDNRPLPAEVTACLPFLARELALLRQVEVVVALGRIAFEGVLHLCEVERRTGEQRAPVFGHGTVYALQRQLYGPRWLVASYHPSRQNTQTGRLTTAMFDQMWACVRSLYQA